MNWDQYVRLATQSAAAAAMSDATGNSDDPVQLLPVELPARPKLPLRTHKKALSTLWIASGDERVNVPWCAIYRDHNTPPLEMPPAACLGCSNGRHCPHGWPLPHPRDVVVVGARDMDGILQYGWMVRVSAHPDRLVRLPLAIVNKLLAQMEESDAMLGSSLMTDFHDAYHTIPAWEFEDIAVLRFARMKANLKVVARAGRKRARDEGVVSLCSSESGSDSGSLPPSPARPAPPRAGEGTCAVCLAEGPVGQRGCCGSQGAVCADCHAKLRGLCPVCDRRALNARYVCAGCGGAVPLKQYGMPCVRCAKGLLCEDCYCNFAECDECDVLKTDDGRG
jgi:hypothetical protein